MADSKLPKDCTAETEELRARLEEAEETLRAISSGEVDALVVAGPGGQEQVYTLKGEERTYRLLIESMNEGAVILTPDGAAMYANSALASITGVPLQRMIGSHIGDRVFLEDAEKLRGILTECCEASRGAEVRLKNPSRPEGVPVYLSLSTLVIDGAQAIAAVVTDLTERKCAEEEKRRYQEGLEQLVGERTGELQAANDELAAVNEQLRVEIAEHKEAEDALAQAKDDAERWSAQLESFMASVVDGVTLFDADGRALFMNEAGRQIFGVPPGEPFDQWDSFKRETMDGKPIPVEQTVSFRAIRGQTLKDFRERVVTPWGKDVTISVSAAPVVDDEGNILGATNVFRDITDQAEFERRRDEVYQREHRIAEVLQTALIPSRDIDVPCCEVAARYEPALAESEVGGDFYDVFDLGNGKVGILIGDVAGKGLEAAIQVAATRHTIRSYAYLDPRPSRVMTFANQTLCKSQDIGMVTAFLAVVDSRFGGVIYANGGHEYPIVRTADGALERLDVGGRVLGVEGDFDYPEGVRRLLPGDIVVLYTDGISESRNGEGEYFGEEGVIDFLLANRQATKDEIADGLLNAARAHTGGRLRDDAAVVLWCSH